MPTKWVLHNHFDKDLEGLKAIIRNFDSSGEQLGKGERNVIRLFEYNGKTINIKSFKIPNIINRIVYRFFRKSKAQRSFEYAKKLETLGIGTPQPMAYTEQSSALLFGRSFYISEHLIILSLSRSGDS